MLPYPLELEELVHYDEQLGEYVLSDLATEEQRELFDEHQKLLKEGIVLEHDKDGNIISIEMF